MKFESIDHFLNFKKVCPLCQSNLAMQVSSYFNDADNRIEEQYVKGEEIHFIQHSSYKIPGMVSAGSFYSFNITLFKKNSSQIRYNVIKSIQHPGSVSANQFVEGFNNSNLFITASCINSKCTGYSFRSIPLFFDVNRLKPRLKELEIHKELFDTEDYECVNNFVKSRTLIYPKKQEERKAISIELLNLEMLSSPDLNERIKTVLTFS
jgi:hypothetical protein